MNTDMSSISTQARAELDTQGMLAQGDATTVGTALAVPTATEKGVAVKTVARRKPAKAAVSAAVAGDLKAAGGMMVTPILRDVDGLRGVGTTNAKFISLVNPVAPPAYVFADGYDLRHEFGLVKHLVAADDPNVEDAAYGRYTAYLKRVNTLENTLTTLAARRYANAEVMGVAPYAVNGIARMAPLVMIDEDTGEGDLIELHTQDAMRLFLGFDAGVRADGFKQFPIPGAVRVGGALRTITTVASKYSNPYSELALMQIEGQFADLALHIERVQGKHEALIALRAKRGSKYKIGRSAEPMKVPLGFKSPYGFACADLVAQFDYLARVVTTARLKGLLTENEARNDVLNMKTAFRGMFEGILRMAVVLGKENLSNINRGDWLMYQLTSSNIKLSSRESIDVSSASLQAGGELAKQARDEAARMVRMRAVHECEQQFGLLPSALLLGDAGPKFVSGRVRVSDEERSLIQQLVKQRSQS